MESYFAAILNTSQSVVCVWMIFCLEAGFVASNFGALFKPPGFALSIAS